MVGTQDFRFIYNPGRSGQVPPDLPELLNQTIKVMTAKLSVQVKADIQGTEIYKIINAARLEELQLAAMILLIRCVKL